RSEDVTAAAAAAGAVAIAWIGDTVVGEPGIAAVATRGMNGQPGQRADLRGDEDRAPCTAAAGPVAAGVRGRQAVGCDCAGTGRGHGAHDDDAATIGAAAVVAVAGVRVGPVSRSIDAARWWSGTGLGGAVVASTRAAAPAHGDA